MSLPTFLFRVGDSSASYERGPHTTASTTISRGPPSSVGTVEHRNGAGKPYCPGIGARVRPFCAGRHASTDRSLGRGRLAMVSVVLYPIENFRDSKCSWRSR